MSVSPMPSGVPIVDTMIGFSHPDMRAAYQGLRQASKDRESREEF